MPHNTTSGSSALASQLAGQILSRRRTADDLREFIPDDLPAGELIHALSVASNLLDLNRELSKSSSLNELLLKVASVASELLGVERCTFFLHDARTRELYTKASLDSNMADIRFPEAAGIAGAIFQQGKTEIIPDAYQDERFSRDVDKKTGFRTRNILCVPIRLPRESSTEVVGVAQAINKRSREFDQDDAALFELLAQQASGPLINAQLHTELAQANDEQHELLMVSTALGSELELGPLLRKIIHTVASFLDSERATLFLHDKKAGELWAMASMGGETSEIRFPDDKGIAGTVLHTGETVNIPDAYADPRFNRSIDRATGYKTKSILCMPVTNREGQRIAVTQALNKRGGPFLEKDEQRLAAFSAQAAVVLQNAQLFAEVMEVKNYNESILDSMSSAVVTTDNEGTVVKLNAQAVGLLGLEAEEDLLGRRAQEFFGPENIWISDSLTSVIRDGKAAVAVDTDIVLRDEQESRSISCNITIAPLSDANDERVGCVMLIEDLTREKRLKSTMSRYVSKEVADQLLEEDEAALGGKLQRATVLFTDIRGFTSISEKLAPQDVVTLLNEYFAIMVDIILDNGGILDKYIGDAIMAVFGVPFSSDQDADHAVKAATEMIASLAEFNRQRRRRGEDELNMGIGINTDEVLSGNIGCLKRMDYTVIGDGVNLASRLEGANKLYGTQMLVSEFSVADLKQEHRLREVDRIRVKGKAKPVEIYEVLDELDGRTASIINDVMEVHTAGLAAFRGRDWATATECFEKSRQLYPKDAVAQLYIERCQHFRQSPPPDDWDGVWVMTDK